MMHFVLTHDRIMAQKLGILLNVCHFISNLVITQIHLCLSQKDMSCLMRKPTICIYENKDADQLRSNREADQRLCFRYTDSTISPHRASYGVYISQLIRFARVCNHVTDFNARNKCLTAKLLQQGYRYHKLRKTFSKFYRRHYELISN